MNKEQLLNELSLKINSGEISYDEMMHRFDLTTVTKEIKSEPEVKKNIMQNFSVTKALYSLGTVIVLVGIILFTYQVWNDIGSFGRISVTLGLGLLLTIIGVFLQKAKLEEAISTIFYFIGGMLVPGGSLVALNEFSFGQSPLWPLAITFGIIFTFYFLLNFAQRNVILTFFTIANGTAAFYLLLQAIMDGLLNSYQSFNLSIYLVITIGACYILIATSFRETWNKKLAPVLYFFGFASIQIALYSQYAYSGFRYYGDSSNSHTVWPSVLSLAFAFIFYLFINLKLKKVIITLFTIINGTAFIYLFTQGLVGGSYYSDVYIYMTMVIGLSYISLASSFKDTWNQRLVEILNFFGTVGFLGAVFSRIYDSLPWQFLFFFLVIGGFILSIYVKSRSILVVSTLFLIAYISYITSEYFAGSVGWPISLVILGFIFIGLGYVSIAINKKYINS